MMCLVKMVMFGFRLTTLMMDLAEIQTFMDHMGMEVTGKKVVKRQLHVVK